jgi:NAD(P)-dependent dehydrogenase (short-subunit alcohol dehydrogenase family)
MSTPMSAEHVSAESLSGTTALVTGASRGLGRGIAVALAQAGAQVVGVATGAERLAELREQLGQRFTPVAADAADPVVAGHLIDAYQPGVLVLAAGAAPLSRPLHQHTWATFSRNWEVDVQQVFHWTREALLRPLPPGSTVVAMSSGAARRGSPLSGGYAGAKAAVAFISSYAADEAERAGLGIRFAAVLPQLTPATDLGSAAVAAYARRAGADLDSYLRELGPVVTPQIAGQAITGLVAGAGQPGSYLLTAAGLSPLT